MQRYQAANCTNAVNSNIIGGGSFRDASGGCADSLAANFSANSRRPPPLAGYKLKCDKEPLNSRLGPPDFHPQALYCPEETLTKEYLLKGYWETVEGLEEAREITQSQLQAFTEPVVFKCREAIRKCNRAINESRAQKRKAGQVYGVPLSGLLLTKPGIFPEQRPCSDDFKKKWIEGLSQPHKRLRSLADHVPHGYRRKFLFEVLIRNNVPLLRATWYIKVNYLNQVRPSSTGISSGTPDKTQLSRTELWTKEFVEYLQILLDEFICKGNTHFAPQSKDRSQQLPYGRSVPQRGELLVLDSEEPSLHFKWWYVVRLLHWHHTEGLLSSSLVIDWVLSQMQEKDALEILQLLLPIIYGFLEDIVLSQTYVRTLASITVRFIREPSPGGSDLVDNSRRAYTTCALTEMLRYLLLAVPDTFVAIDCFPLPLSVMSYAANDGTFASKASERPRLTKDNVAEVAYMFRTKGLDAQYQSLSLNQVVSTIQKRANNLARAACPGYPVRNVAKAVQALDKALMHGDISGASDCLFENFCDGTVDQNWIEEIGPWLRSSLTWIGTVSLPFICSVFLLCEWATCDYRDFRTAPPDGLNFSGGKDFSQVHIVRRLLSIKLRDMQRQRRQKNDSAFTGNIILKGSGKHDIGRTGVGDGHEITSNSRACTGENEQISDLFESPGPLHDIIVCWIDQHEICKGGLKRILFLVVELMRSGIFYPQAYVRQLISSGAMDMGEHATDLDRRKKHYQILKQLPGSFVHDILQGAGVAEGSKLSEVIRVYTNERRLLLNGLLSTKYRNSLKNESLLREKILPVSGKDDAKWDNLEQLKAIWSTSGFTRKRAKMDANFAELKTSISALLRFPNSPTSSDSGLDESQGSSRKPAEVLGNEIEAVEGTPGCEDCRKAKRQKLNEEKSSCLGGNSPISDDERTWWVRKGSKQVDSPKLDPPLKSTKQASKGRQKIVRKTQSLAQLAANRLDSSLGASTSHVCDNKSSCPHHRTVTEGELPKPIDGIVALQGDIASTGKALRQLRLAEKQAISAWVIGVVHHLVEEAVKNVSKMTQFRSYVPADDRNATCWKLGEDELSKMLYLIDACGDLVSAARLLLWLLPKVPSNPSSTIHTARNMVMTKNVENQACEVGETFLFSALRRYENTFVAADLIPEVLSAAMQRVVVMLSSSGRVSGAALVYSRHLLRKYGNIPSVSEWEKSFKSTCDKQLLPEIDCARSTDAELGYPFGVPSGVEDIDDFIRQKMSVNRLSRLGISMRDIVQRNVDEAFEYFNGKDRKGLNAGTPKGSGMEKKDDGYWVSQQIVTGLMECIRQTGGAAQEGDPSLVSSAVSAIVHNIGPSIAKMPDFVVGSDHSSASSSLGALGFARCLLRIHVTCLCLLKEALGERQSCVFEIALANEASSSLAVVFAPGKTYRSQFQSPEAHDSNANISHEPLNHAAKSIGGRSSKSAAAISALVIQAVIRGVSNLERMVTAFRLKEGLDITQYLRSTNSNSNGNARMVGTSKVDTPLEVYVHWFRLLVGNCRTACDGLVVELLDEQYVAALSRMQRLLPISLIFPPAYSIFAFVIWRPLIFNSNPSAREDVQQLCNSLTVAIGDAVKHLPFRDACLRDSQVFYDMVAADKTDADFAALIDSNGLDRHFKYMAFVPLRGRLFLNAIIDCKIPFSVFTQDDGNRISGHGGSKLQQTENGAKLLDKLVDVLDSLQPAKFHWQWVELRLLLNEQAVIEKLETLDMSFTDAIRSAASVSENENNIIEIILTRLLVRPDAAPLFSELIHLLGRSLEDSMLMQAKWFLGGPDVLYGRKSISQRLTNIAESKGVPTKARFWKAWGWSSPDQDSGRSRGHRRKFEVSSLEEGEVIEENAGTKKSIKGSNSSLESESVSISHQQVTERALIQLVLPCINQSSEDSQNTFASELIKQLNNIEQQMSALSRGVSKQPGMSSGLESPASKGGSRKGGRGGSPGLAKQRTSVAVESSIPSCTALRTSMILRLRLLMRLLPAICSDGELSGRNMRHMLASVILRLLGSRVVHEDADWFPPMQAKRELWFTSGDATADLSCESLFDRLLLVLHALLSGCRPSWLKPRPPLKLANESSKESFGCDRELAESLQNDLDRMPLPGIIRWRIQSSMPILFPSSRCSISCQPSSISAVSLAPLQLSITNPVVQSGNQAQRNTSSTRAGASISAKSKVFSGQQDGDMEIDPWTLLEDGTGSVPSSSNTKVISSGNHSNLRASSWLKGAVRVRRMDLTYIGAVDEDS